MFNMIGDEYMGSTNNNFNEKSICDLLNYFSANTYQPNNKIEEQPSDYLNDVMKLMEKDYRIVKIPNHDGNMCFQYPYVIPIMESHRNSTTIYENEDENKTSFLDEEKTTELFEGAKLARCRQRFPVPVILFRGQNICRSSTVASLPEICYRNGLNDVSSFEALASIKEFLWPSEEMNPDAQEVREAAPLISVPQPEEQDKRAKTFCDKVRNEDIRLLKSFNVNTIVDIMVEKRKVKHGLYVSASEKVDRERYSDFKLISLPYPGCEFFKDYHDALFNAEGLKYNWNDPANDADISVPNDNLANTLSINWQQYREWDLVLITQNYVKYIVKRLQEDSTGLLLHCISGWDRTPLFISLIRLSLWADGLAHESLNEYEIVYLTLAYDWYLFGHHLANRLFKCEEIMAFCFDFLKYITGEEFSVKTSKKKHSDEKTNDDSRSPSRSSNGSSVYLYSEENIMCKDKKGIASSTTDYVMLGINENSNDSTSAMIMDINFEESDSPKFFDAIGHSNETTMDTNNGASGERPKLCDNGGHSAEAAMKTKNGAGEGSKFFDAVGHSSGAAMDTSKGGYVEGRRDDDEFDVLSTEDAFMDTFVTDYFGKSKVLPPTNPPPKRTAPILIGNPGKRSRSDSTGSNTSNVSATWLMISECGSVEKEHFNLKPLRLQKLEKARTIFNACYQKTVKQDSYGPPKKWVIEEIVSGLAQWLERNRPDTNNGNADSNGQTKNGNDTDISSIIDSK